MESTEMTLGPMASESIKRLLLIQLALPLRFPEFHHGISPLPGNCIGISSDAHVRSLAVQRS